MPYFKGLLRVQAGKRNGDRHLAPMQRTPAKPLLTGWSLVRIRPGEPSKSKTRRKKPLKLGRFFAVWQRPWQQSTGFVGGLETAFVLMSGTKRGLTRPRSEFSCSVMNTKTFEPMTLGNMRARSAPLRNVMLSTEFEYRGVAGPFPPPLSLATLNTRGCHHHRWWPPLFGRWQKFKEAAPSKASA